MRGLARLLPVLACLLAVLLGGGAGLMLRPAPQADGGQAAGHEEPANTRAIRLNNQIVVPVIEGEGVQALVVVSLGLRIDEGAAGLVHSREAHLLDAFLQVLLDHGNAGGFSGQFTGANRMELLRLSLLEAARDVLGQVVHGVLITGLVRQDR